MSWEEQFKRSLAARDEDVVGKSLRFGFAMPTSIEEHIAGYFTPSNDSDRIALAGLAPLLIASFDGLWREIEHVWPHKWPTETSMFFAVLILATGRFEAVSIGSDGQDGTAVFDRFGIEPQKQIGEYRVDFLLRGPRAATFPCRDESAQVRDVDLGKVVERGPLRSQGPSRRGGQRVPINPL